MIRLLGGGIPQGLETWSALSFGAAMTMIAGDTLKNAKVSFPCQRESRKFNNQSLQILD